MERPQSVETVNKEKKKIEQEKEKNGMESKMSSWTLLYFPTGNIDNIREGKETSPPPLSNRKNPRIVCSTVAESAPHVQ